MSKIIGNTVGTPYNVDAIIKAAQSVCVAKNQGTANVGKILVVGTDGNLTLIDMPEGGASGDVVGTLDESNNILLSGNLADGTYTLKYENTDGTYTEIGTLEVGAIPEPEPIKNLADPTSADWLTDNRLATGYGYGKPCEGHILTNYIPAKEGDILRVKGLSITEYVTNNSCAVATYTDDKVYNSRYAFTGRTQEDGFSLGARNQVTVNGDMQTYTIALLDDGTQQAEAGTTFIRIDGVIMEGYTANDVIITINEEIE